MNGSLRTIVSFFMNIYSLGLITGLLITSFAQADAPANLRPPGDTATWRQDLSDQAWEENSRKWTIKDGIKQNITSFGVRNQVIPIKHYNIYKCYYV